MPPLHAGLAVLQYRLCVTVLAKRSSSSTCMLGDAPLLCSFPLFSTRRWCSSTSRDADVDAQRTHLVWLKANVRDAVLGPRLAAEAATLQRLEEQASTCEAAAERWVQRGCYIVFALLLVQMLVLFYWTYIRFDWNLVEPITYVLGYSVTWLSLAWFSVRSSELTYGGVRCAALAWRRQHLHRRCGLNVKELQHQRNEVQRLQHLYDGLGA